MNFLEEKKTEIKTGVYTVTPSIAKKLLERNKKNRHIRESSLRSYTKEMEQDNWMLNGESIKIDTNGVIMDGQHRLHALSRQSSDKAIDLIITENLPPESFTTIDTGKNRNSVDILSMKETHLNRSDLQAISIACKALISLKNEKMPTSCSYSSSITNEEVLNFYEAYSEEIMSNFQTISDWCFKNTTFSRSTTLGLPIGKILLLYTLAARQNQELADDFFKRLIKGSNLSESDPLLVLRESLINEKNKKRTKEAMVNEWRRVKWIVRSLNAYYTLKPILNDKTFKDSRGKEKTKVSPPWLDIKLKKGFTLEEFRKLKNRAI